VLEFNSSELKFEGNKPVPEDSEERVTMKAMLERERADLKLRMEQIRALASTPRRAVIITHREMVALLQEIEKLAGPHAVAATSGEPIYEIEKALREEKQP
jgi:hypothetical protein